ncbi:hypothetical protein M0638_18515 [Roseomonas sp. NAR14]|uniref:Uncharacterized protein n=1 Tax=Roseomonas acroporae TaxID=2937791 RepID=A0A9X2BXX0_9PROT|nr:hypothetical protein [Roseomonas acroporae]MCK8786374.1 hypothetical protein [Roseomonas acroporae]
MSPPDLPGRDPPDFDPPGFDPPGFDPPAFDLPGFLRQLPDRLPRAGDAARTAFPPGDGVATPDRLLARAAFVLAARHALRRHGDGPAGLLVATGAEREMLLAGLPPGRVPDMVPLDLAAGVLPALDRLTPPAAHGRWATACVSPAAGPALQIALLRRLAGPVGAGMAEGGTLLLCPPAGAAGLLLAAADCFGTGAALHPFAMPAGIGCDLVLARTCPAAPLPGAPGGLDAAGEVGCLTAVHDPDLDLAEAHPDGRLFAATPDETVGHAVAGLAFRWRGRLAAMLHPGPSTRPRRALRGAMGLVLDFGREGGGWHRLFLAVSEPPPAGRLGHLPGWGAGAPPDAVLALGGERALLLDLPALAPAGWSGEVILSVRVEDLPRAALGASVSLVAG